MNKLNATVFPSEEKTIFVEPDTIYGGAHHYEITNCLGFENGRTQYDEHYYSKQTIRFIEKKDDGKVVPGLQSEQLVLMLIDRHEKLNARFPSPQNEKMLEGLRMFLAACKERVEDRISRGTMGKLEK